MRVFRRIPFILILTGFITIASAAHATECLSSADAVWAAHPGSHATWRLQLPGHVGEKCWFASPRERKGTDADASTDSAHEIKTASAIPVPVPRPRLQDTLAETDRARVRSADDSRDADREIRPVSVMALPRPHSQDTLAPTEREPLPAFAKPTSASDARSILMWGTPMQIDATWEEMFAGRERRGAQGD
jgi:hypothetical protein